MSQKIHKKRSNYQKRAVKKGILQLKTEQRVFYKSIVSIYCEILSDTVYFTSEGFNHLIYQSNRKPRNINEQYLKLMCLDHVPLVVKKCAQISKTKKIKRLVKGKVKTGFQHELVYEIKKNCKIRVIIEKIGTGKNKFLSVMPHNKRSKTKKRPNRRS